MGHVDADRLGERFVFPERHEGAADPRAEWPEYLCAERTQTMRIGGETYRLDKEGYLMPAKDGQKPPSLQYFRSSQK